MDVRCLIVDDSVRFLDAAEARLSRNGTTVVGTATTSAEAVCEVERLRPDVALVDVSLGAEDGFELTRRLAAQFDSQLRIVLISTRGEEDLAELVAESPAVGFIPKSRLSPAAVLELLSSS